VDLGLRTSLTHSKAACGLHFHVQQPCLLEAVALRFNLWCHSCLVLCMASTCTRHFVDRLNPRVWTNQREQASLNVPDVHSGKCTLLTPIKAEIDRGSCEDLAAKQQSCSKMVCKPDTHSNMLDGFAERHQQAALRPSNPIHPLPTCQLIPTYCIGVLLLAGW